MHFLVHCKKLEASSQVFEDIFSTGKPSKGDKRARVELAETADVLESLLPYCYSISVADVQIDEESWGVIKAAEKYQVRVIFWRRARSSSPADLSTRHTVGSPRSRCVPSCFRVR